MHWAVACKKKEVFDYLIKNGIELNSEDLQGKTELHVAVQYNNAEYLKYLNDHLPNDSWQSKYGASLLEIAVLNGHKGLLEQLITTGINVDAKNDRGSTALEIAQRIENDTIASYLKSQGARQSLVRNIQMTDAYMGSNVPDSIPQLFAPNFISTEEQEFSAVFNAAGTAIYYGADIGPRNEIRYSELKSGVWTKPVKLLSDDKYSYNDPFLSNDEQRLYFISDRALDGQGDKKDIDIWYISRMNDTWSAPINVGKPINTEGNEYYISFADDGTMYFASNGQTRQDTSRSDHDIYYSKMLDGAFQQPVVLSSAINTKAYEADVFVSPDESYLIFSSDRDNGHGKGDLYISFKDAAGQWTEAQNMGKHINTEHYEYCPFVSKNGKYLFFTRNQDVYWLDARVIETIRESLKK